MGNIPISKQLDRAVVAGCGGIEVKRPGRDLQSDLVKSMKYEALKDTGIKIEPEIIEEPKLERKKTQRKSLTLNSRYLQEAIAKKVSKPKKKPEDQTYKISVGESDG